MANNNSTDAGGNTTDSAISSKSTGSTSPELSSNPSTGSSTTATSPVDSSSTSSTADTSTRTDGCQHNFNSPDEWKNDLISRMTNFIEYLGKRMDSIPKWRIISRGVLTIKKKIFSSIVKRLQSSSNQRTNFMAEESKLRLVTALIVPETKRTLNDCCSNELKFKCAEVASN